MHLIQAFRKLIELHEEKILSDDFYSKYIEPVLFDSRRTKEKMESVFLGIIKHQFEWSIVPDILLIFLRFLPSFIIREENCVFSIIISMIEDINIFVKGFKCLNIFSEFSPNIINNSFNGDFKKILITMDVVDDLSCVFRKCEMFWKEYVKSIISSELDSPILYLISHSLPLNCPVLIQKIDTLFISSDERIRAYACSSILLQMKHGLNDQELLRRIVDMALFDESVFVRLTTLQFLQYVPQCQMCKINCAYEICSLNYDSSFCVRRAALNLIGKMSSYSPLYLYPEIRKALLFILTIINDSNRSLDEKTMYSSLLEPIITHFKPWLPAYSTCICDSLIRELSLINDNSKQISERDSIVDYRQNLTKAVRALSENVPSLIEPSLQQFLNCFIWLLQQRGSPSLSLEICRTLISIFSNSTSLMLDLKDNSILQSRKTLYQRLFRALAYVSMKQKSQELNIEILKLMGCVGALEQSVVIQSEEDQPTEDDSYRDKYTFFKHRTCSLLLQIFIDENKTEYHREALSCLVKIYSNTSDSLDQSYSQFILLLLKRLRYYQGNYYLELVKDLCTRVPSTCYNYGQDIMSIINDFLNTNNEEVLVNFLDLIAVLGVSMTDRFLEYIPQTILFLCKCSESNSPPLACQAILSITNLRYIIDDYLCILIPHLIELVMRETLHSSIIKSIIESLTVFIRDRNCSTFSSQLVRCAIELSKSDNIAFKDAIIVMASYLHNSLKMALRYSSSARILEKHFEIIDVSSICLFAHSKSKKEESHFNEDEFIKIFMNYSKTSEKWFQIFTMETIRMSPNHNISLCHGIAQQLPRLASYLFDLAFLSCWDSLSMKSRSNISDSLFCIWTTRKLSHEEASAICRLYEFMEHWESSIASNRPEIYKELSIISFNSWHLAKAIFFAHRWYYNCSDKQKDGCLEEILRLSAKMGLDKTVKGILLQMKNKNNSPLVFQQLGMWEEARNLLVSDITATNRFEGILKCFKHELKWKDLLTFYYNNDIPSASSTVATALIELSNRDRISRENCDMIIRLLDGIRHDSIQGAISAALFELHRGNTVACLKMVELGFQILAKRLKDKDLPYPLLVKAQQLHEITEIANNKGDLLPTWITRLRLCKKSFDVYHHLFFVRLSKFSPCEMQESAIKMLKFALKAKQLTVFDEEMCLMYPDIEKRPLAIQFTAIKGIWAHGYKDQAIFEIHKILNSDHINNASNRLASRMFFIYGHWVLQTRRSLNCINDAVNYLEKSIKRDTSYYRAWHRWSWACSSMFFAAPTIAKHAINAINGFLECVKLKNGNSFTDLIQMIYLVFLADIDTRSFSDFTRKLTCLDDGALLSVLPQFMMQLQKAQEPVLSFVINVIIRLLPQHYHVILYPLLAFTHIDGISQSNDINDTIKNCPNQSVKQILESFNETNPAALRESKIISDGLISCSTTPSEFWRNNLSIALRFAYQNGFQSSIDHIKNSIKQITNTPQDLLVEILSVLDKMMYDDMQGTVMLSKLYTKLKKELSNTRSLKMSICAPLLSKLHNSCLAVPGTYSPGSNLVTITLFDPTMDVYRSKQRPRHLVIVGNDGSRNRSLLKGNADLRLDQRIMQFFGLINQHIAHELPSSNLQIFRYSITPISNSVGLIQFVDGADTFFSLISDYRSERGQDIFKEKLEFKRLCDASPDSCLPIQRLELIKEVVQSTEANDLREILWLRSPSSREWINRVSRFAQSSALMSIIGYVLGLGDRHPSNLMIHRYTGSIIHIDFSDCFDITKTRLRFPEPIPFRLTRMMISAFGPSGIEGDYRITCEETVKLVRDHRDSIMAVLEAKRADEVREKGYASHYVQSTGYTIIEAEEENWSFDDNSGTQLDPDESIERIREKIRGNDNDKIEMSPEEQVNELIRVAIDQYNIAHLYQGWIPLW